MEKKKTANMLLLEAQRNTDIRSILVNTLEERRATRTMVRGCCDELGVSYVTFYKWCAIYGVEVGEYHWAATRG